MIYLYYLMLGGFLLLSQAGPQSHIGKAIKTQEFLGILSNFTEARSGLGEKVGAESKVEEGKQKVDSDTTMGSKEGTTTIYFYKKISGELQL